MKPALPGDDEMKPNTLRLLSLITLGAAWEIAGRTGNARLLPPISKVLSAWFDLLVSGQLFHALGVSLQALAIGFVLSVLFGVPLGLLMGRYRRLEAFLDIYMTALLTVPMISFIPFLVIAFGLGLHSRVWIVFLFAFVIIAINTAAGVRNVDPTLDRNGQVLRRQGERAIFKNYPARRFADDHGRDPSRHGARGVGHGHQRNDSRRGRLWRHADDF